MIAREARALANCHRVSSKLHPKFERHYPNYPTFWTTRASRELRLVMAETAKGWKILGFGRKGGHLYDSER